MGGDGAHMGVSASRALETILGDEPQPSEAERRTPAEMRLYLLGATPPPWDHDGDGYGQCARWIGRQVLEAYLADPALVALPMDDEYETIRDGAGNQVQRIIRQRGLHGEVVERGGDITGHGITGFQWGWAVNAARYAVDADAQPNPAILEVPESAFEQLAAAAEDAGEAMTALGQAWADEAHTEGDE